MWKRLEQPKPRIIMAKVYKIATLVYPQNIADSTSMNPLISE